MFDFAKVFDAKFISTDILINFGSAFQKDPTSAFTAMVFLLVFLVLINCKINAKINVLFDFFNHSAQPA